MRKNILWMLMLLSSGMAQAKGFNNGEVKGVLLDEKKEPVPYATVILKHASDSSLYKGEISNDKGEFAFEYIKEGSYRLEVQCVGFEKKVIHGIIISSEAGKKHLGNINLKAVSTNLKAVNITAEKPFIERQIDKTVVNIEHSSVHAGSSIMDVMEKMPGVLVDQDGNISLKGKQGVIIMMDGKPTVVSGQDLANMLKGMSSSGIQKVEIITNPSAKYDASGNSGIINIVSKRNKMQGFNGSVSSGYGQGRYEKYNLSTSLNYKKGWYNLFFNYGYSYRKGFNNLMLNRRFYSNDSLNTVFSTDNYILFPFKTHTPRAGADFTLSKRTTLSVLASGVSNKFNPSAVNHTDILDGNENLAGGYIFNNRSTVEWNNVAVNTQLRHQFDTTGREITFDMDHIRYWSDSRQTYTTDHLDALGNFVSQDALVGDQGGSLEIYSAKSDYTHPVDKDSRFEAGLKSSYVNSDTDMKFYNKTDETLVLDTNQSNHFIYAENISAAYVNMNRGFDKFSVQLGLRAEHTLAKGKQVVGNQNFERNYIQLFPSVFLNYKFNDKHALNSNIGRRIDRPGYFQMNPFRRMIDATTYGQGNPYLRPQLTYKAELTYTFKNSLFATLGYSLTSDNITNMLIQDAEKKVTIQTDVNLNTLRYYNLNLSYSKRLTPWWNTNTSILSYYGKYSGVINNFVISQGVPSFNINTANSFTLMDGLSMECNFLYNHKSLYGVTRMKETYNLSLGVQKSLFKKKASLTVNVSDLLWTAYPSGVTQFGNVTEHWTSKRDTRVVNINFTYRFGKGQTGRARKTGADDEIRRVGSGS